MKRYKEGIAEGEAVVAIVVIRGVGESRIEEEVEGVADIGGVGDGGPEAATVACAPE